MVLAGLLATARSMDDAIDLALGIPPGDPPAEVVGAAVAAITGGRNQYAPPEGTVAVRELIAHDLSARRGLAVHADEVTVTCGATEGLLDVLLAVTDPGDEVLLLEPGYEIYPGVVGLTGAVPVAVPLTFPDWRLDLDRLAGAITPRTRAVLLNTPHNPTGRVFDAAEVHGLVEFCARHGLVCVTDETYERFVYDGRSHVSPLGLGTHVAVVGSLSKSLRMSGWRIGYVVAPAELTAAVRLVHERTTVGAARPLQEGVAAWTDDGSPVADFQRRRDHLVAGLAELGFGVTVPEGGWFAVADVTPLGYRSDEFAADLLAATGVLLAPGSAFFTDHRAPELVRATFVRDAGRTAVALDRIGRFLDTRRAERRA
ncbi:MAG: pyridoxal phosphate-dependent aminotransferase [Saccharothrix sp.]|nr:pyridoxal phosphate-dependent aminotransferase [Saccharothrix sp.]